MSWMTVLLGWCQVDILGIRWNHAPWLWWQREAACTHAIHPVLGGGILTHRDTTSILHGPLAKSNGTTCHNVSNFLGVGNAPNITEHIQRSPCCRSLDKSKAAELWHIPLTPPATHEGCQIEKNTRFECHGRINFGNWRHLLTYWLWFLNRQVACKTNTCQGEERRGQQNDM